MYCFRIAADDSKDFRSLELSGINRTRTTPFRLIVAGSDRDTPPIAWTRALDSTRSRPRPHLAQLRARCEPALPLSVAGCSLGADDFDAGGTRFTGDLSQRVLLVGQSQLLTKRLKRHTCCASRGRHRNLTVTMFADD